MKRIVYILPIIILSILVSSCNSCSKPAATRTDTARKGHAEIASDDCLKRIVDEMVAVFEATTPEATILPRYMPENDAINLVLQDSLRLAIVTRDMREEEKEYIKSVKETLNPRTQAIAMDAIAIVAHPDNPDTLVSMDDVRRIMEGEVTEWGELFPDSKLGKIKVVFDNAGSSTVRYIRDSICGEGKLSKDIFSAKDNQGVLSYVGRTKNAMGIVGVNWVSDPYAESQLSLDKRVRVMAVSEEHPATHSNSFLPYPAHIARGEYPMYRVVYVWLTDFTGTLPSGFTHFLATERGQRIVLKSGLVPATMPTRTIRTREEF